MFFVLSPIFPAATSRSVPQRYVRPRQGPLHLRSVFGWGHSETVPSPQWHPTGLSGNRESGRAQRSPAQRCRRLRSSQLTPLKFPWTRMCFTLHLCAAVTQSWPALWVYRLTQTRMEDLFLSVCPSPVLQLLQGPPGGLCQSLFLSAAPVVYTVPIKHRVLHFVTPHVGNRSSDPWSVLLNHDVRREMGKHVMRIR